MKTRAFRDIWPYSLVEVERRFRGAYCLHNQGDDDNGGSKSKAVPLHAMEALGGRGGIAPTHSRPRH
jgi:hypothetical protein